MPKEFSADLVGEGLSFAIVVGRFNEFITHKLLDGAVDSLIRHGVSEENVEIFWVPGAFEIPLVARKAAGRKGVNAVICLGAVIRGSTPHFEFVASEAAKGVAHASLESGVPILFGVITADTLEQAIERAGTKAGNKGAQAATAAIEMANLISEMEA